MDNTTGYAWGTTNEDQEWLIIPGTHWAPPVLTEHPEGALRPYLDTDTLARVERWYHPGVASGRAFRILHVVPTPAAEAYDPLTVVALGCPHCPTGNRTGGTVEWHPCPETDQSERFTRPVTAVQRYGGDAASRITGEATIPGYLPIDEQHIAALAAIATRQHCETCQQVTDGIPTRDRWLCAHCAFPLD